MQTPAPTAPSASVSVGGNNGNTQYAYYVIANYPGGSVISQAAIIRRAPDTLSSGNYVNVGWQALTGATNYDVIRLLPRAAFTGSCTCAVATGLATTSVNDIGSALTSYTIGAQAVSALGTLYVNNTDYSPPQLRQIVNGVDSAVAKGGGGGGGGTVTSITINGTAGQITVTGSCTITVVGTCTISLPSGITLPGTINNLTLTRPATGATLTIADGKTITVNNSLTLGGSSDGLIITFPVTGTVAMQNAANTFTGGTQDASGAPHTLPVKAVGSAGALPATCTAGELAINTAATLGQQIYECSAGNVWTQQLNTGGGGGGLPTGTPAQIIVYNGSSVGTATTVSGDSTISSTGVTTNKGLNGVPLCTGFTPTNGQVLEYTTGGAPNPCYTAVATSGGGGTVTQVNTTGPITGGPITTTGAVACPTCGVTTNPLSQFASTTSAQLAATLSNETGTGLAVFNNSPTLIAPVLGNIASGNGANLTGIPNAGLVNSSTTVNGQICTLGATCIIPLSAVNAESTTYAVLAGDFSNYKTITVASGSFTITLVAGGSQPPAGQYINIINYSSGTITIARNGQSINGGTGSLTLSPSSATSPMSAYIISDGSNYFASKTSGGGAGSGTVTSITAGTGLTGGTITNAGTIALAIPVTIANGGTNLTSVGPSAQVLQSNGTGMVFNDVPDTKIIPAANCVNGVAGSSWSTSTITPTCFGGANNMGGVLPFADSSTGQFNYELPLDWSGGLPWINLFFSSGSNTSGTVNFNVQTACSKSDGSITADPGFPLANSFPTMTMAASGREWSTSTQMMQVISGNNCVPGGSMIVSVYRTTDSAVAAVLVDKITITTPVRPVNQAN